MQLQSLNEGGTVAKSPLRFAALLGYSLNGRSFLMVFPYGLYLPLC